MLETEVMLLKYLTTNKGQLNLFFELAIFGKGLEVFSKASNRGRKRKAT